MQIDELNFINADLNLLELNSCDVSDVSRYQPNILRSIVEFTLKLI